jgi:hypothetical protein
MPRGRKTQPTKHGTLHAYRKHGCRCVLCGAAQREHCAIQKAKRIANNANAPHGTTTAYINWKCRCDLCKIAGAVNNKQVKERMIARGWKPKPRKK